MSILVLKLEDAMHVGAHFMSLMYRKTPDDFLRCLSLVWHHATIGYECKVAKASLDLLVYVMVVIR